MILVPAASIPVGDSMILVSILDLMISAAVVSMTSAVFLIPISSSSGILLLTISLTIF